MEKKKTTKKLITKAKEILPLVSITKRKNDYVDYMKTTEIAKREEKKNRWAFSHLPAVEQKRRRRTMMMMIIMRITWRFVFNERNGMLKTSQTNEKNKSFWCWFPFGIWIFSMGDEEIQIQDNNDWLSSEDEFKIVNFFPTIESLKSEISQSIYFVLCMKLS